MRLTEVVIDRLVLDAFKRRAFKSYPKEYAEKIWGTIKRGKVHICFVEPFDQRPRAHHEPGEGDLGDQTRDSVDYEFDQPCGSQHSGLTLLGSVHTHPPPFDAWSSDADIQEAHRDKEIVYGICAIRKHGKRRFTTFRFWGTKDGELEFVVAETAKKD